jgi:hypothetical protein
MSVAGVLNSGYLGATSPNKWPELNKIVPMYPDRLGIRLLRMITSLYLIFALHRR